MKLDGDGNFVFEKHESSDIERVRLIAETLDIRERFGKAAPKAPIREMHSSAVRRKAAKAMIDAGIIPDEGTLEEGDALPLKERVRDFRGSSLSAPDTLVVREAEMEDVKEVLIDEVLRPFAGPLAPNNMDIAEAREFCEEIAELQEQANTGAQKAPR